MRLLFVTSFYPPLTGGGASRTYDFSRLLASMRFDVTVLTFLPLKRFFKAPKLMLNGVKVLRFPWLGFKHPLDQVFTSFVGTLLTCISQRVDFIIVSVPMGEPCIGAFLATCILKKKLVVDIRDEWEDAVIEKTRRFLTRILYRFYKQLFNKIYRKSNFVITVTPTLVERTKERGINAVHLLPNAADIKLFHLYSKEERSEARRKLGLQDNDFVLVYAGVVGWYYRIDVVLKAIHEILSNHRIKQIRFLIIGTGDKWREWSILSKKLGLEKNVFFLGERKLEEVAKILPSCNVGLIPLNSDPIRRSAYTAKFFEYCATGLPSIVSIVRDGDLGKLVNENKVGYVVKPEDIREMAETILKVYKEKEKLKEMRLNARKLAVEKFNREKIVRKLAELLRAQS